MNIGIISCRNVKDDGNCASAGCFHAFNTRTAGFEQYAGEDVTLVAYNTCAGCPTLYAHDKILKRVKPMVEFSKADKIHFTSCMMVMCPFIEQYKQVIEQAYPQVEVVIGTDMKADQNLDGMANAFRRMITGE
jgi:predicted metal-binding protein